VRNTKEAENKYKELLTEAGVTDYGMLIGEKNLFFFNSTTSVVVPDEIGPIG
jgi:hypothetical protein